MAICQGTEGSPCGYTQYPWANYQPLDIRAGRKVRAEHRCPARMHRDNLFRGILFCDCCGHPLTLSRKKLKYREVDIYLCSHHNLRPDDCPRTHIIYHEVLYPYVLEQLRALARSMRRRKIKSPICQYADVPDSILVGHINRTTKLTKGIQIHWRLWCENTMAIRFIFSLRKKGI